MKSVVSFYRKLCTAIVPWFRVTCLVSVVGVFTCALALRGASAQLDGAMISLGSRVMSFPGAPVTEARTLRINGVDVRLRTEVVAAPLARVLRHYRRLCASSHATSGVYGSLISALATRNRITSTDGYVACVETRAGDLETLTKRLVKFSRTWDLSDVGPLRYAYATPSSDRPEDHTFLMTIWADGPVDLRAFMPIAGGDAGGLDPIDVPRPPGSQRILSATEMMAPSGVYIYLARVGSTAAITRFYRNALVTSGYDFLERGSEESVQVDGVRILSAEKAGRLVTVLAHADVSARPVVTLLVSEVEG
jgi:hypothetical protein